MIRTNKTEPIRTAKLVLALILTMILLSAFIPTTSGMAEEYNAADIFNPQEEEEWGDAIVIWDDPIFFMEEEEDALPFITSVGKTNVKIRGVKSKYPLVKYTIPEQLLAADPNFLALMIEAEKYIGYPYVYGWVFNQSGVFKTKRLGANGLYSLCQDIPREEARPGDLVFFEKTMGTSVKGITHVGIYVGNNMMIHAGDPVGFADLKSEQWAKKIYGFGRLPID